MIEELEDFGFIILRTVTDEKTNQYWIKCYESIRRFYNNKIIIIDSQSDLDFVKIPENLKLENCETIISEYPGSGSLSCFYYFYNNHFFKKAVILHDSMIIQQDINFASIKDVQFIMHFKPRVGLSEWHFSEFFEMLNVLIESNPKLNILYDYLYKFQWELCLGTSCIIDHDFLLELVNEYNLFELLKYPKYFTLIYRCGFERLFGLLCCHKKPELVENPSLLGCMAEYYEKYNIINTHAINYDFITKYPDHEQLKKMPILKYFTHR